MHTLKDINWNHLYCFYEVAKVQSLRLGAKTLRCSPSTASEQIKALEKKFQKILFLRVSNGLTLTTEGAKLFEYSRNIFEEGSKVLDHFSEDLVGGYSVSVGIVDTIADGIAAEFTSQYWDLFAQFGTVNTIKQSEYGVLEENLALGNVDWGISLRPPKRKSLLSSEIGKFELIFCCSKKLYRQFKNPKDLLGSIPLVQNNWDNNLNKKISQLMRREGIVPREKIFSDHPEYINNLCSRGRCIMLVPKNIFADYKGLEIFSLDEKLELTVYAIWRKSDENLVSHRVLKQLLKSNFETPPERYQDVKLQLEASDVDENLLKK